MSLKDRLERLEARAVRHVAARIAQAYGRSAAAILGETRVLLTSRPEACPYALEAREGHDEV